MNIEGFMKRNCFIFALTVLMTVSAFAEKNYSHYGFNFCMPVAAETAIENGEKKDITSFSIAFGIDMLKMYSEKIGLYANFAVVFPQNIRYEVPGEEESVGLLREEYDSLWGLTSFIGPAICLRKTDSEFVTVSPGFHYVMISSDNGASSKLRLYSGIGLNMQSVYFIGSKGYLSIGFDVAYDFFGLKITDRKSSFSFRHEFSFIPRFGVGFRL